MRVGWGGVGGGVGWGVWGEVRWGAGGWRDVCVCGCVRVCVFLSLCQAFWRLCGRCLG